MRTVPYIPLLLFSALCAIATWCGLHFTGHAFTWHFALLLGYFAIVTLGLLYWQEGSAGQANIFIRRFMAGLVVKLMGSLILLAILVKTSPPHLTAPLGIVFACLYVAFLGYSVVRLSKVVRAAKH